MATKWIIWCIAAGLWLLFEIYAATQAKKRNDRGTGDSQAWAMLFVAFGLFGFGVLGVWFCMAWIPWNF